MERVTGVESELHAPMVALLRHRWRRLDIHGDQGQLLTLVHNVSPTCSLLTVFGIRCSEDIVPETILLESIMNHYWSIADGPHITITILVELNQVRSAWKSRCQWLIEKFNGHNDVLV